MIFSHRSFSKPLFITITLLLIVALCTALNSQQASAATQFITTWKTNQSSSKDASITIPTATSSEYNYFVNWGDGSSDSGVTGNASHTYAQPGTYTVTISGQFPRIFFNNNVSAGKIISVDNWGSTAWDSMVDAFEGCSNLQINAADTPNLSRANSLSGMFRNATSLNTPMNNWDLRNVTSVASMFEGATSFNQNIGNWNTQGVQMFAYTFNRATSFNQNINSWDMSSALSTNGMFAFASSFDQPVNNWNVSKVKDMRDMFANATSFNQDVSSWNTTSAQRVESVFRNAVRFDQDISSWSYSSITDANYFFNGSRLTGKNYDQLLLSLSTNTQLQRNVIFDAGTSNYCFAGQARQKLIDTLGWQFKDNGQDASSCGDTDIRFTEGLAATVNENQPVDTVVGELVTVHPNPASNFSYSFCSVESTDAAYFRLEGNQLLSNRSFDYENPVDGNQDNVYELCIVSTDPSTGFNLQRLLTVAVIDQVDPNGGAGDGDGQVLSGSTDDPNNLDSGVLGASDDAEGTTAGKVLAATGIAVATLVVIGLAIATAASFAHKKTVYNHEDK